MDAISSSGSKRGDERWLLAGFRLGWRGGFLDLLLGGIEGRPGSAVARPPSKTKGGPGSGCPSKSCLIPSQLGIRKSAFAYLSGVLSVAVSKKKKIVQYVASDKTVGLLDGFALVTTQHNTGNSISIGVDDVIARFPWAGYFLFSGLILSSSFFLKKKDYYMKLVLASFLLPRGAAAAVLVL